MYILHNIDMKIEEPIQYNFPYSDVEVSWARRMKMEQ